MKCKKCGSEKGFVGRQAVDPVTKVPTEPERIFCERCGEECFREKEQAEGVQVLDGPPAHLSEPDDAEKLADEMLAAHGAPDSVTPEERQKLIEDIRASKA